MYALIKSGLYRGGVLPAPPSIPAAPRGRLLYGDRRPCPCEARGLAGAGSIPSWAWWVAGGLAVLWAVKK